MALPFVAVAVAQCLLVISEDNPIAWRVLNSFAQDIVSLIVLEQSNEKTIILRTVAAAILSNVPGLLNAHVNQIFETLNQALDINHRTLLGNLTSSLPLDSASDDNLDVQVASDEQMDDDESEAAAATRRRKQDLPTEQEIEIKQVGWTLEAQRIAAETITNFCSSDDNGRRKDLYKSVWEEIFDSFSKYFSEVANDDDDDLSDAESVHDYDQGSDNTSAVQSDKLPIEILEPIKSYGLVEKLWQRAQPLAENVNDILMDHGKTLFKK